MTHNHWEAIIGLEVHVELNTKSKLFSPAINHFGDAPNTNISPICTGQPGSLPRLNQQAVYKAVQLGLAIKASINPASRFDRKSYFYPDSPRNFQITQFDEPILKGGYIEASVGTEYKKFAINRAHLEDDAGMLKHFSSFAGVDDNRAGVPLIEIVSEPCIYSAKEATAYVQALKEILLYIDASDVNMEEGSLRMDVNVSVRPKGEKKLRHKIEIKNMNSFAFMEMAIDAEIDRQIKAYEGNSSADPATIITPATYRWDVESKKTVMMRTKEMAEDYRYFLEPDLPPVFISEEYIEKVSKELPELPQEKRRRYQEIGVSLDSSIIITSDKGIAHFFEEGLKFTKHAVSLCNWIIVEFAGRFKDSGDSLLESGITPKNIATLVNLIDSGKITGRIAKSVADEMVATKGGDCEKIIASNPDYQPMDDMDAIATLIDQILQQNPQSIADFKAGKERAFGFLVGQVMKESRGKAPPVLVNELLRKKLLDESAP